MWKHCTMSREIMDYEDYGSGKMYFGKDTQKISKDGNNWETYPAVDQYLF